MHREGPLCSHCEAEAAPGPGGDVGQVAGPREATACTWMRTAAVVLRGLAPRSLAVTVKVYSPQSAWRNLVAVRNSPVAVCKEKRSAHVPAAEEEEPSKKGLEPRGGPAPAAPPDASPRHRAVARRERRVPRPGAKAQGGCAVPGLGGTISQWWRLWLFREWCCGLGSQRPTKGFCLIPRALQRLQEPHLGGGRLRSPGDLGQGVPKGRAGHRNPGGRFGGGQVSKRKL